MKNIEAKQISDKHFEIIPKGSKPKDLLHPWYKLSSRFEMHDPTKSLFTKYIAFYLTVITSGNEDGYITTDIIMNISKSFNIGKDTTENCIKDLVHVGMMFKLKRGSYQINPLHLNKKSNVEDSNALVKKSQNIQIVNNYNFPAGEDKPLIERLLAKGKEMNDLNQL
jgi:hypothetical protein